MKKITHHTHNNLITLKIAVFIGLVSLLINSITLIVYAVYTNPFNSFTIVQNPYRIELKDNQFELKRNYDLNVHSSIFHDSLAYAKAGTHIALNAFSLPDRSTYTMENDIITEIHTERFHNDNLYITTGQHFSVLYPRNLGIFFLPTLDPRTALNDEDWSNRQISYAKSVAMGLEVFSKHKKPCTTVIPISRQTFNCVNIYSYQSDALYGLMYGLLTMKNEEWLLSQYPFESKHKMNLQTKQLADSLISDYQESLKSLLSHYVETVYNKKTGLIKKDIHLSSAKDITKRESAFYDNVILWRTLHIALELEIIDQSPIDLDDYKKRIITAYWLPKKGYFLEDLSENGIKKAYYSSDWLIAHITGFIDPSNQDELSYYERSIAYIRQQGIDKPFGLKYQSDDRAYKQHSLVRLVVPEYGGSAIWSLWGMEYIRVLLKLYDITGNLSYLTVAQEQFEAYKENITKFQGFPEVYNANGEVLETFLYRSVWKTSWVVNYVQVRKMIEARVESGNGG